MPKVKSFFVLVFRVLTYSVSCLSFIPTVFGQQPVFRHYTTADGLPSSETYCAIQDDKGYMWFGTDRGLTRYNGYDFKVYTSGESGLQDNTIYGLYRDHKNRIWLQTFSGTCGYWMNDSLHPYAYQDLLKSNMQSRRIDDFSIDRNDGFMATRHEYIHIDALYIDKNGKTTNISNTNTEYSDIYLSENMTTATVSNLNSTITRIISQETHQVLYTFYSGKDFGYPASVCRRKNGDLLVYTSGAVWLVNHKEAKRLFTCKAPILSMILDKDDNFWVGYLNKGLEQYKSGEYSKPENMLVQYSISGMTQDHEGGLWFATLENGIFYLPPGFILSYGPESGLPTTKIIHIEKIDSQLFFVLSDHTLASKAINEKTIRTYPESPTGLLDLVNKPGGKTYYGAMEPIKFPGQNKYFHIPVQRIHTGRYDTWGYIGSQIFKVIPGEDTLYNISFFEVAKVTALLETGKDELLIATLDGLFIYKSGKINSLRGYHSFFTHRISDIIYLDNTHLAFASIGYGILVCNINNYGDAIVYTQKEGLPSNICNMLCRQNDTTLIIATNKGICMTDHILDPQKVRMYNANINDGLISDEINDIELVGMDLWIGTTKGISIMPAEQLRKKTTNLFLNMEQVSVNNVMINPETDKLFLHDMNNMQFTFSGISYQHSSELRYKYRLKGSDDRWNITAERSVIYNSLSPGDYIFEVMMIGSEGKESQSSLMYAFSISPPFWNTWWFIIMMFIVLVWVIYMMVARRIRTIREQAEVQNDLNIFRDKALRTQMNPHFIYNSMNAIQNYIQKHETRASINYLTSFSRLMRMTFANSGEKEVSLEKDLETVSLYAEMENMRFSGNFKLQISYGADVDPSRLMIPPFLIQPFVENAILHGLRPKALTGNILINIHEQPDRIKISIQDDGIGRAKTLEAGKRKQAYFEAQDRKSSGTSVTLKRLRQAWGNQYKEHFFIITDLYTPDNIPCGTLIEFYLPLIKL